jgi:putative transposase
LGIDRKSIYYQGAQTVKDLATKSKIEQIHKQHPAYGHKRIAIELGCGKNKALRVMHKFNIKPPRRRVKYYTTRSVNNCNYTNLIKNLKTTKPAEIYASDLTYIKHQGKFIYLATVQDQFTREIVASAIGNQHDSELVMQVVAEATSKAKPTIFHSDQGSEFMATEVTTYLTRNKIQISVSDKASPWQNGYKESFYSRFKEENGDLSRFTDLGELIAEIYSYIHYYNTYRIHTSLKMPPTRFKLTLLEAVSHKSGT